MWSLTSTHTHTQAHNVLYCSAAPNCTHSSVTSLWKKHWRGKSRCRGNKELSELTAPPLPPPVAPSPPPAFPPSLCASSQEPPEMQTYTHSHTHTHALQAAVRQAASHPAKSLNHMPSQPIQWDRVQVARRMQHIQHNGLQVEVEQKNKKVIENWQQKQKRKDRWRGKAETERQQVKWLLFVYNN